MKLALKDQGHVQKLADALDTDRPLLYVPAGRLNGPQVSVRAASRRLAGALRNLGVTQAKSFTVQPWNGPDELMSYYWRGLFDGDGHIGYISRDGGTWQVNIVGNLACVQGFADWAGSICYSKASPHQRGSIWGWTVGGNRKAQLLARALRLTEDMSFGLERKQVLLNQLSEADFTGGGIR